MVALYISKRLASRSHPRYV